MPPEIDDVAHAHRVANQDEQPGDQVLDQRLRAEADGEADHACAGQQSVGIDPELGQDLDDADRNQHRHGEVPRHAHQGAGPVGVERIAVDVLGSDVAAGAALEQLAGRDHDGQDEADAAHGGERQAPVLRRDPAKDVHSPSLSNDQQSHTHHADAERGDGDDLNRRQRFGLGCALLGRGTWEPAA